MHQPALYQSGQFLSTLSLRRATVLRGYCLVISHYFYPRSPCGERLLYKGRQVSFTHISIHALLAESDGALASLVGKIPISIHALLAESDPLFIYFWLYAILFLSTLSLRRATVQAGCFNALMWYFYPRSPCGERRVTVLGIQHRTGISIHALLAESDSSFRFLWC